MLLAPLALAAAVAAAPPVPKVTAPEPGVRAELDALQATLEAAVGPVSHPAGFGAGRGGRAYLLRGFGAVVVLAPRALPRGPRGPQAQEARVRAELARSLEERIAATKDATERRRLEVALRRVRESPTGERRVIVRLPPPPHAPHGPQPFDVEVMVEEAEAFRRAAEEAMERAERDVRFQLRVPEPLPTPPAPPVPVVAPEPPGMPPPPRPPQPPEFAAPFPGFPPPGPFFWVVDDGEGDSAAPQAVVADVRRAIARGLRAHRGRLDHLAHDEVVAVAVDFLPRMADRGAAPRTVVARAKKSDLDAARAGRLDEAGLLARIEFDEY
jgi:hypothetical protein